VDGRFGNWLYFITWLRTWRRLRPIAVQGAIVRFGNNGRLGARAASRAETGHTAANVSVLARSMADGRVSETPRKLRPVSTDPAQVWNLQWRGLRPSVLGQDRSETKEIGLGLGLGLASCGLGLRLVVLVLFYETRSCNARRHNDLGGQQFLSTIYSFSILCVEHH